MLDRELNSDELAFAYTRLAKVEEAAGRKTESRTAFMTAILLMKKANPEITDEQLERMVHTFDAAMDKSRM